MKILSLFDGIACGRIALEKANIDIEAYYASEIEQSVISIAKANYPDIIEIGDVKKISYKDGVLYTENGNYFVGHIDLLIGGSPCTDFSSIGYAKGMKSGKIEILSLKQYLELKTKNVKFEGQSYLFWEYIRLLNEIKPDYYLLENVVMSKKWQKIIDNSLSITPLKINSSLVSAQNRVRLYWTNIKNIVIPNDKNINLDNILDKNASKDDVSHCQTVQKAFPKLISKYGYIPKKFNAYNSSKIDNKACTLSRGSMVTSSCATLIFVKHQDGIHHIKNNLLNGIYPINLKDGNYNLRKLNILEMERLQTIPDNYTKINNISLQKKSAAIGNGWTIDVISHILSFIGSEK